MVELAVTLRFHGRVVERRNLEVRGAITLGEGPDSVLPFEGGRLVVAREGAALRCGGRRLTAGEQIEVNFDTVELTLRHVVSRPTLFGPHLEGVHPLFDRRALLLGALLVASLAWAQSAASWGDRPEAVDAVTLVTSDLPPSGEAPPLRGHHRDPSEVGEIWYRWYRRVVPRGDAERARAQRRLDQRPEDADALLLLARNAANADEDAEARQLYLRLLTLRPDDHRSRRRLAWVEQRLGEAEAALQTLDAIPAEADEAREVAAMWALLLVRTGQTDAAERVLAPLDPEHPLVAYAEAQLSLARGELEAAVDQLSTALLRLDRASPEDQVEIHRELALDPALAPLRSSARIRLLAARLLKPTSG